MTHVPQIHWYQKPSTIGVLKQFEGGIFLQDHNLNIYCPNVEVPGAFKFVGIAGNSFTYKLDK